ncbi:MAG: lysophospholipase [Caulobacteraceae bacterium]
MKEEKVGSIFVREWKREDSKANVVIIHGVAEHSGRYAHVAEYLHERGMNVYTGDLIGHGLSDGTRVFVKSADEYLENVKLFLSRIDDDKPVFILGHSMGGFIVLYYSIKEWDPRIKGVITTSPYLKERLDIPTLKLLFGRTVAGIYPKLHLNSGIKSYMVCRDKEICRKYEEDKLNTSGATVGWFTAMEKARKYTIENAAEFKYPCLMLQAGSDIIVDPEANRRFFDSLVIKDKDFELYKDFYHEILNDPGKERVLNRINNWIEERI